MIDFDDDGDAVQCLADVASYFGWKIVRVNDLDDESVMAGFILGDAEFCASVISIDKSKEEMI